MPARLSLTDSQIVSLHTVSGVQLHQFLGSELVELRWTRESREVSQCEVVVPGLSVNGAFTDIVPWLHWISVWDSTGQALLWTGPVIKVSIGRDSIELSARDMGALFARTRCPLTKRWDVSDPADIASDLIKAMVEHHGLNVKPVVRYDPLGDKFDYAVSADAAMLDVVVDDLSGLGLFWTVLGGVPLLGPLPREIVAAMDEIDFVGDGLTVVRDGRECYNDVLLRAADNIARAKVPMGGLELQTTVDIDSMFGVSNADRAVKQYARYVSVIRDTVVLPDNAVLHPQAPVTFDQLVPSSRFTVNAYGFLIEMELVSVSVENDSQSTSVSIRLEAVNDELPELVDIQGQSFGLGAE